MRTTICAAEPHRAAGTRNRPPLAVAVAAAMLIATALSSPAQVRTSTDRNTAVGASAVVDRDIATGGRSASSSGDKIRVVVRSYETASIGAEINAKITHLPQREGDRFRKGERLIEFDCRKLVAEFEAASAARRSHQAAYEAQLQMQYYKAAGSLVVAQARFDLEKSEADVRGLEAKITSCTVFAPFDGRVVEKLAQMHEIAQPNQPILKVINESKLELVLMVPSSSLASMADGTRFWVRIDENGEHHEARILQSTGLIDPVSQSARLIAELVQKSQSVLPGMSGTASFTRKELGK